MRIIQFASKLATGGAEMVIKDYLLALKAQGHDVAVMVYETDVSWPYEQIVRDAGIPVVRVGFNPTSDVFLRVFRKVFGKQIMRHRTIRFVKEFKPDVIHTHLDLITVVCDIRKQLKDIKLVYTCHSEPEKNFGKKELKATKKLLAENGLSVIALHEAMAKKIKAMFCYENVIVLENPIDVARFQKPAKQRPEIRKELDIPDDAFVVGHVGRFVPLKNHEWLIRVFKAVLELRSDAFLLMVGDGEDKERIVHILQENELEKRYLIIKNRTDMPEIYSVMDVFVFPSLYEGLSVALLEAQTAGIKCVVSDAVSPESFAVEKIFPLSLNSSVNDWRDAVVYDNLPLYTPSRPLEECDLRNVIKKLLCIYNS